MKKDNKRRMAKFDPENAYAWQIILDAIRGLRAQGKTQKEIAHQLGVNKDTVSRWLSENRGGERSTFGMMLRCAKALNISYEELIEDFTPKKNITPASNFDESVARVLEEFAQDDGLTISDLAKKTSMPASNLNALFAGEIEINVTMLNAICNAIDVGANLVLKRATKKLKQEQKDTTANAARTRSA